eukprot:5506748-Ditylum_brightwellii.AAC.1
MGRGGLLLWYSLEDQHGSKEDEWIWSVFHPEFGDSSKIEDKCHHFRYAAPQSLGIMQMEWNLLAAPTCRAKRKGFLSDDLELNKNAQHREYVCKVGP